MLKHVTKFFGSLGSKGGIPKEIPEDSRYRAEILVEYGPSGPYYSNDREYAWLWVVHIYDEEDQSYSRNRPIVKHAGDTGSRERSLKAAQLKAKAEIARLNKINENQKKTIEQSLGGRSS